MPEDSLKYKFVHKLTPRFTDLDAFGMVNNATFLTYFEEGRVAFLRELKIFSPLVSPISIVIKKATIEYLCPIRMGNKVGVHLKTGDYTEKSFNFYYSLWLCDSDVLAARGKTLTVSYNLNEKKSAAIPKEYLDKMLEFEKAD